MALVHGGDTYTYVTVAPRTSSSDDPAYPGTQQRVPLVGDTMTLERDTEVQTDEIAGVGAVRTLELGTARWRGTFTTLIYYNATWFHWFLCQLMGGCEVRRDNYLVTGEAAPGTPTTSTHWYIPQSYRATAAGSVGSITHGLVMRVCKMGPEATTHKVEKVGGASGGMYITGVTLDFPAEGWPTATWEVLGPKPSILGPATITPVALDATDYPVRPQDNSRANAVLPPAAHYEAYTIWIARNWRRFSLTIRRPLEFPPYFANDWAGTAYTYNAGMTGKLEVTAEMETLLEGDTGSWVPLSTEYLAGVSEEFQRRWRWVSASDTDTHSSVTPQADATNDVPYALQINAPTAIVESAQAPVESGGVVTLRWTERWASKRQQSVAGAGYPWDDAATDTYKCPVVIACQVADADDSSATFSVAGAGGNAPHSSITG